MADGAQTARLIAEFPDTASELGITAESIGVLLDSGISETKAMLASWRTFAGKVSTLTDVSESGSSRSIGSLFDRAKQMIDFWQAQSVAEDTAAGEVPYRARGASHTAVRV